MVSVALSAAAAVLEKTITVRVWKENSTAQLQGLTVIPAPVDCPYELIAIAGDCTATFLPPFRRASLEAVICTVSASPISISQ